jgi:hypothetical protein
MSFLPIEICERSVPAFVASADTRGLWNGLRRKLEHSKRHSSTARILYPTRFSMRGFAMLTNKLFRGIML